MCLGAQRPQTKVAKSYFYFQAKRSGVGGHASKPSMIRMPNDHVTRPLKLLRHRIEDDGATYQRKAEVLIQKTEDK